ncbi:MAG: TlpA family protein disulfide reductase [Chitinispirillaceae bacterium]|nr:TlpA family protein disulfide reductase [Chitinispirillaceae bacterium]
MKEISCGTRRWLHVACILFSSVAMIIAAEPGGNLPAAPRFSVRDINNRLVSIDTLIARGPLIVDFWATWCAPCMAEFRAIEKLVKKYGDKNLTVLAVSEDGPSEAAKVKQTVRMKKWPFIVVMDNGRSIAQKFNVTALPALFLIGSDGKIRMHTRGFVPGDEAKLEEELREITADK